MMTIRIVLDSLIGGFSPFFSSNIFSVQGGFWVRWKQNNNNIPLRWP
jgi:hypothetical protein